MSKEKKFNNIYIRSSLECDGTVPAKGSSHESPDIFSNGTEALPNHIAFLSDPDSYMRMPEDKSTANVVNHCYLRCKNNTDETISEAKAELFTTTSSLVLWPENWKPMHMDITKTATENTLTEMKPGDVGVVRRPFIWDRPQFEPANNHYCFIGRLFTNDTPNPLPPVRNPIDMSAIIKTNLMYAKRNIFTIEPHEKADGFYSTLISTASTLKKEQGKYHKYHLFFNSTKMAGCDVEITCSSPDSEGRRIRMERRRIENDDDMYFGQCMLEPGFSARLNVYIYYNGLPAPTGGTTNVWIDYSVMREELTDFKKLGLYSEELDRRLRRLTFANDDETAAFAPLGGVTGIVK